MYRYIYTYIIIHEEKISLQLPLNSIPTWEDGAEGADGADADIPPMRSGHRGGEACKHVQTQFCFDYNKYLHCTCIWV